MVIPKQTIRLGAVRNQYHRKHHHHRGKQKSKVLAGVGSAGKHSPLHEVRSEDEDEDE